MDIIQPASVPESPAVFFHNKFVNASRRGSGEEEGQGGRAEHGQVHDQSGYTQTCQTGARGEAEGAVQNAPESETRTPDGRAVAWGIPKRRMCAVPGDLVGSTVDTL